MSTATAVNLWPADIGQESKGKGIIALLKMQGQLLSEMTDGLVTAEVKSEQEAESNDFRANFYLYGPKINYRYLLLGLRYPAESYPAQLLWTPSDTTLMQETRVGNDEELEKELRHHFESEKTRQVIGAIIEHSK